MRSPTNALRSAYAALIGLIIVNVLIELSLLVSDLGLLGRTFWRGFAYQYGAFWAGLLHNWLPNYPLQPWTMFVTYAFLHGGWAHLISNMIALWLLGRMVIIRAGLSGFSFVYATSAVGGGIVYGLLAQTSQPMVGASGAIFGLVGAILYWRWAAHTTLHLSRRPILISVIWLATLNFGLWVLLGGYLAWQTHLGGFIAGWMAAMLLGRFSPFNWRTH